MVGIISVVIGGHFGGGDHFDGGDHFGGGTFAPGYGLLDQAPPSEAIRRFLHKSASTATSYIRSDSVEIVQQDAPKQPGETPCKGWTDSIYGLP